MRTLAMFALALLAMPSLALADSPSLIVNKQIGDIRMGESEAQVGYEYGPDCFSGCAGRNDGCVLGRGGCVGPMYRYKVSGGYLRIGYRQPHRGRPGVVTYIETNSPHYKTATGLGVGSKIPFGKRFGVFHWHACDPSDGYWVSSKTWGPYHHRYWTQLSVSRGRVGIIQMWRDDLVTQEC
jgi:hypothetical protein